MKLTAKANTVCLLEILKEYSDCDNILKMKEIIEKMKYIYGLSVDRRTVYSSVAVLFEMGYDISIPEENGVGYYLDSRDFDSSEVRLLMDSVYSNPCISHVHSGQLIKKIQKLLPQAKRRMYSNLTVISSGRKTDNKEVFHNIDYLDEAINVKRKVEFTYLKYDFDKRLKPRRTEKYIVSPYAMAAANDRYYLLCKCDSHMSAVSQFRIDKIKDIEILDRPCVPCPKDFSPSKYSDQAIFMYGGEVGRAVIKCDNCMLDQVIDRFGTDIKIEKNNDNTFTLTVTGSLEGLGYWAKHYIDVCEVIEPQAMRDKVIGLIKNNKYNV